MTVRSEFLHDLTRIMIETKMTLITDKQEQTEFEAKERQLKLEILKVQLKATQTELRLCKKFRQHLKKTFYKFYINYSVSSQLVLKTHTNFGCAASLATLDKLS
jgi:hypothetical protein